MRYATYSRLWVFLLGASVLFGASDPRAHWQRHLSATSDHRVSKALDPLRRHLILDLPAGFAASHSTELAAAGVQLLQFIPERSVLAAVPASFDAGSVGLSAPQPVSPEQKLSAAIANSASRRNAGYLVEFYPDVSPADARAVILAEGIRYQDNPDLLPSQVLVFASLSQLATLAAWDEVAYIFPASDDILQGRPVRACHGPLTVLGPIGQYIQTAGDGWGGPGHAAAQLSYVLSQPTTKIDVAAQRSAILRAMGEWSRAAMITFVPGTDPKAYRTIHIWYADGDHGDGFPFDGPGGVLAHTFYPNPPNPEPLAGDLHLDASEKWRLGADIDLEAVVLHELGHALGLGHSDTPTAVMYPYYNSRLAGLTLEDKQTLLRLYPPQAAAAAQGSALTLTVLNPSGNAATTAQDWAEVDGVVAGATGGGRVSWQSDQGPSGAADVGANWRVRIPLRAGANTIVLTATDATGARATQTVVVTAEGAERPPRKAQ